MDPTTLFFCAFACLCSKQPVSQIVNKPYDFVIVGAGSAGSVIANRLTENPRTSVLLIEAGDCPSFASEVPTYAANVLQSQYDWNYKALPQNNAFLAFHNNQTTYPRGKMLGGSSSINAMMYIRGNKHDFDHWAKDLGNVGWSYNDLMPYFLKAEGAAEPELAADKKYHNTKGPLTVSRANYTTEALDALLKAAEENHYTVRDINAKYQTGFMQQYFTIRDGSRCSTAKSYLLPAQNKPNLKILCNTRVTKIKFDRNKKAIGVELKQSRDGPTYFAAADKEVILSAGAIGSPQILLASGVGPKNQLEQLSIPVTANRPGVGENLQDHVGSAGAVWKVNCSDCTVHLEDELSDSNFIQWNTSRTGLLTLPASAEGVGYVKTRYANPNIDWPDVQLLLLTVDAIMEVIAITGADLDIIAPYYEPFLNHYTFTIIPFVMRPESRGNVKLQSSDIFDDPLINLNFYENDKDLDILAEGYRIATEFGNSNAYKKLGAEFIPTVFPGCESFERLSHDYWKCVGRQIPFVYFHPVGTCKMGKYSDRYSVVDNQLRVYGVTNLRVIDASVMPTVPSANTNAATIALAEKASDIVKRQYSI
ncbi:hypothetical protein CHUAL_001756 [Chamberlinius hualienensis]